METIVLCEPFTSYMYCAASNFIVLYPNQRNILNNRVASSRYFQSNVRKSNSIRGLRPRLHVSGYFRKRRFRKYPETRGKKSPKISEIFLQFRIASTRRLRVFKRNLRNGGFLMRPPDWTFFNTPAYRVRVDGRKRVFFFSIR